MCWICSIVSRLFENSPEFGCRVPDHRKLRGRKTVRPPGFRQNRPDSEQKRILRFDEDRGNFLAFPQGSQGPFVVAPGHCRVAENFVHLGRHLCQLAGSKRIPREYRHPPGCHFREKRIRTFGKIIEFKGAEIPVCEGLKRGAQGFTLEWR